MALDTIYMLVIQNCILSPYASIGLQICICNYLLDFSTWMSNRHLKLNMDLNSNSWFSLPSVPLPLPALSISVNVTTIHKPKAWGLSWILPFLLHSMCNPSGSLFDSVFTLELESKHFSLTRWLLVEFNDPVPWSEKCSGSHSYLNPVSTLQPRWSFKNANQTMLPFYSAL